MNEFEQENYVAYSGKEILILNEQELKNAQQIN
jgi:hypothetical protein